MNKVLLVLGRRIGAHREACINCLGSFLSSMI